MLGKLRSLSRAITGKATSEGPDGFAVSHDDPLLKVHKSLDHYVLNGISRQYPRPTFAETELGRLLLQQSPEQQREYWRALVERAAFHSTRLANREAAWSDQTWNAAVLCSWAAEHLLERFADHSADDLALMLEAASVESIYVCGVDRDSTLKIAVRFSKSTGLNDEHRRLLKKIHEMVEGGPPSRESNRRLDLIDSALGCAERMPIVSGEAWADQAIADLEACPADQRTHWLALIKHCGRATGARPAAKWSKAARELVTAIGSDRTLDRIRSWLALVDKPRTRPFGTNPRTQEHMAQQIIEPHADILRGLIWCLAEFPAAENARVLTTLAVSAYRKLPGIGPRCVKVGNACIYALGSMPGNDGVAQLAILKSRIKLRNVQKEIEKALNAAAQRAGIPKEELEEMSVPTYGMEEVGLRRERFGEVTAELTITGTSSTAMRWINAKGKPQKAPPATVKAEHADDLKDLKSAAKDIERLLPALRDRLDHLMLHRKTWPLAKWRERYLDHPLMGTLARRLIWVFEHDGRQQGGLFCDGRFVDAHGQPFDASDGATVEIWHPINAGADEIQAWRALLEQKFIVQPFKQAHRELYLLTDAERATNVYSNRFAAHIIRQHQFNALAAGRGWINKLRLMVDDEYPPATLLLPDHQLRAEFWVEGVGGEYGQDTNETGVYHYLATDQVRFYRMNAAQRTAHAGGGGYRVWGNPEGDQPLPLDTIPPLVLSEVMRDVDLFVGVGSVGNDASWFDGRSTDQREYWNRYCFGDLSATAHTRREVLQRLIPRLAIADRCTFSDKFLIVRGDLRTYKIHLGSGNILMEPNDQYLCIVASRGVVRSGRGADQVFLPFEGDGTLSIILSKAMMLADDRAISDPTIVSQIKRG